MRRISRKELSSLLITFSFFQFGILQPVAVLLGTQNVIAASTILIVLALFAMYKFHIKIYIVFVAIIITILFLSHYFLFDHSEIILSIFIEFFLKCYSLFLIASFPFSTQYLKKYFYIFSIINFIGLAAIVALGYIQQLEYMRFGYAMLPSTLVFMYTFRHQYRFLNGLLAVGSLILMVTFGSRGPIVGVLIFILIVLISDKKIKINQKIASLFVIISMYFYLFISNGFLKILNFIYYDLHVQTYSIRKLRVMVNKGLAESSSGRDFLYEQFLNQTMKEPIFGSGIGISHKLWEVTPHNLFLQILLEFGIVGMGVFLIIAFMVIRFMMTIRNYDNELFLLISIIFSVSFGRLLVSSDIWVRQELWFFISLIINGWFMSRSIRGNYPNSIFKEVDGWGN